MKRFKVFDVYDFNVFVSGMPILWTKLKNSRVQNMTRRAVNARFIILSLTLLQKSIRAKRQNF